MSLTWFIMAICAFIAIYSAIQVFTNLNNKQKPSFKYYVTALIVFAIITIILIIYLA